jgi:2-desacetyl-2-hydroxyethyl bacteriochlorophyllide A dehydrogenase
MRIAVLRGPNDFAVVEEPVPEIGPDEVLIRTGACGVCASELDTWEGRGASPFPLYPGHEVSGSVVGVGAQVEGVREGDAVAVWATGRGFAEYVAVKAEYCRPAGGVPVEEALAEPVACATNAVELADVRLGDDVVVLGAGFMGNLVQQLVQLRGVRHVVVADTRADALERATKLGATRTVDVTRESLTDVVADLTGWAGADVAFEVTGTQAALRTVGDVTRMSGKIAIVGYHQGAPREIPLAQWNWMAFQIVNAHFRDVGTIMRGMSVGMRLLTAGRISLEGLVTHRFALDDINEAFATAVAKPQGFVKSTVVFPV